MLKEHYQHFYKALEHKNSPLAQGIWNDNPSLRELCCGNSVKCPTTGISFNLNPQELSDLFKLALINRHKELIGVLAKKPEVLACFPYLIEIKEKFDMLWKPSIEKRELILAFCDLVIDSEIKPAVEPDKKRKRATSFFNELQQNKKAKLDENNELYLVHRLDKLFKEINNYKKIVAGKNNNNNFEPFFLNLSYCSLKDKDIFKYLIPFLKEYPAITKLDLSHNEITDNGAKALVYFNRKLNYLNIQGNNITETAINELWECDSLSIKELYADVNSQNLEQCITNENELNLTGCRLNISYIKTDLIPFLVQKPELTRLILNECKIGDEFLMALAIELSKTRIKVLSLEFNKNIGPQSMKALANSNLTELSLNDNNIGDEGLNEISQHTMLKVLRLVNDSFSLNGIEALAQSSIETLELGYNSIGVEGVKAILVIASLKHFIATECSFGDENDEGLLLLTTHPALETVELDYSVSDEVRLAFEEKGKIINPQEREQEIHESFKL